MNIKRPDLARFERIGAPRIPEGFTVIELLFVIGIIALLVTLLGSAVMSARDTAKRIECSANLKQVGLAVQEYYASFNVLPCSGQLGFRYISTALEGSPGNWDIYGSPDPCMWGPCPEVGDWARPRVLLCPSDPLVHRTRRSISYSFSAGLTPIPGWLPGVSDGVGFADIDGRLMISFRDITDGTSSTACASELLVSQICTAASDTAYLSELSCPAAKNDPHRFIWTFSADYNVPSDLAVWLENCESSDSPTPHFAGNPFNVRTTTYDHVRTPNQRACFNPSDDSVVRALLPATSLHRGGVNLLLCDGAVRFVASTIETTVWRGIGTRNGSEIVGEF